MDLGYPRRSCVREEEKVRSVGCYCLNLTLIHACDDCCTGTAAVVALAQTPYIRLYLINNQININGPLAKRIFNDLRTQFASYHRMTMDTCSGRGTTALESGYICHCLPFGRLCRC